MKIRFLHLVAVAPLMLMVACSPADGEGTTTTTSGSTTTAVATSTTRSDATVTLDVDSEIAAGTDFTVIWSGPDNADDYIAIAAVGAEEGTYDDWFYTRDGPDGILAAPLVLGEYEIRYVDGQSETTVHSVTIQIVETVVALETPDQVEAGSEFEVAWVGPDGDGDYVTIVPAGSPQGFYDSYFETGHGNPGTLTAAVEAGEYEIRYVAGAGDVTLRTATVIVVAPEITLDAPAAVNAGSDFEVIWTGPDGARDYITIVPVGSPDGAYLDYEYTSVGSPITLSAPGQPGDYEVRYLSERVAGIFFSVPIEVR